MTYSVVWNSPSKILHYNYRKYFIILFWITQILNSSFYINQDDEGVLIQYIWNPKYNLLLPCNSIQNNTQTILEVLFWIHLQKYCTTTTENISLLITKIFRKLVSIFRKFIAFRFVFNLDILMKPFCCTKNELQTLIEL